MTSTRNDTWQVLTAENSGLPATHVTGIAKDGAGNLWFATYGGGLCRRSADGREWKKRASMPSPFRYGELIVDGEGHKWVSLIMLGDIFLVRGVAQLDSEEGDGEWTVFNKDSGGCIRWTIRNLPRDGSAISWRAWMPTWMRRPGSG